MRPLRPLLLALSSLALALASAMAMVQAATAQDNPIPSQSSEPVLPDPVRGQGANYPPAAVTADQAYGGPPRMIAHGECSALNPCALPSSAPHRLGPLADE
jgi:hypothetical protein